MAGKKPRLNILKNYGIVVKRVDTVSNFADQAESLCAFMIDCCPEGTIKTFAEMTGADYEAIFDAGNKVFLDKQDKETTHTSDRHD